MTKKLSQFGHNVRKYKLVNAVIGNCNTNMKNDQNVSAKKQAGGYVKLKHVFLSNKYPSFLV